MRYIFALIICLTTLQPTFANTNHIHASALINKKAPSLVAIPSDCEIEIANLSSRTIRVFGTFNDGSSLVPFSIPRYDSPHYISLFYHGYCHNGMQIHIETVFGSTIYSRYTYRQTSLQIISSLFGETSVRLK